MVAVCMCSDRIRQDIRVFANSAEKWNQVFTPKDLCLVAGKLKSANLMTKQSTLGEL
jgi:hypothetical protein